MIRNKLKTSLIAFYSFFKSSNRSKSIFYHDIHSSKKFTNMSTSIDLFENHIQIIQNSDFKIVREITDDHNQIQICFDDGFKGIFGNMNIINRLNVPITIFIVTSFIDKEGYLSLSEIKELNQNPLIRIESHTHTHADLTLFSKKELDFEFSHSKKILEDICDNEITSLCYPKGIFNDKIVDIASHIYKLQYSSLPGNYYDDILPSVKRRSLVQFSSINNLRNIINGGDHILYHWYKFKHFNS